MKKLFQFNSLKKKILFGFSLILSLVLLLGIYNFLAIKKINSNTTEIVDQQLELLITDEKIALNMAERTSLVRGYLLYNDQALKDKFDSFIDESIALEERVLELSDSEEVKELIDKKVLWGETLNIVFKEFDNGNKDKAMEIMSTQVRPLEGEITDGFKALAVKREEIITKTGEDVKTYGQASLLVDVIVTLVVIALGIVVSLLTARMIAKPIVSVMNRMKSIAGGDLSQAPLETK